MAILQGLLGLLVFVGIAYLFSSNRRAIDWRLVITGVILQIIFGVLITQVPAVKAGFQSVGAGFVAFMDFSREGSKFVFGGLADPKGGHSFGVIVAFQVLTTVIFVATVSSMLYFLGILQRIVYWIAWFMKRTMRLSGPESLAIAGNIFMGQTEAPLLIRPYISKMTKSEIMLMMTGGMAHIAGAVMAAYVTFLGGTDPAQQAVFAAHLLSASIMNAPAAIVMAKMLLPQTEHDQVQSELKVSKESIGVNLLDAMAGGASEGVRLALNIGGMLIAFIAVIAMINAGLGVIGEWTSLNPLIASSTGGTFKSLSLDYILGQVFRLLAVAMGVSWDQSLLMGSLLGQKTAINEFIAYKEMANMKDLGLLEPKTILIGTYALCGFSNFSSIAIQIGGIGVMAPNQQSTLSKLGMRALLAASLACMMTATIAGAIN